MIMQKKNSAGKTLLRGGVHMQHLAAAVESGLTAGCESVGQQREDSGHYPLFVIPKVNSV